MESEKVRVNPDGTATLKCPQCGTAKSQEVSRFEGQKSPVQVHCDCGSTFQVLFELGQKHRKGVNLEGYYKGYFLGLCEDEDWSKMQVTSISVTGIEFLTPTTHSFKEGHEVKVKFTLDDGKSSKVDKNALVSRVEDRKVGCEFTTSGGHDETSDKALKLYLMS